MSRLHEACERWERSAAPRAEEQQAGAAPRMQLLFDCRHDELVHREEARSHADTEGKPLLKAWQKMIEVGSHIAVGLSTRW